MIGSPPAAQFFTGTSAWLKTPRTSSASSQCLWMVSSWAPVKSSPTFAKQLTFSVHISSRSPDLEGPDAGPSSRGWNHSVTTLVLKSVPGQSIAETVPRLSSKCLRTLIRTFLNSSAIHQALTVRAGCLRFVAMISRTNSSRSAFVSVSPAWSSRNVRRIMPAGA